MPVGTVRIVLDLHFEGDYYDEDERAGMATHWIDGGLDDRSDLVGWTYVETSHRTVENAAELPGMWEEADLIGGATDVEES